MTASTSACPSAGRSKSGDRADDAAASEPRRECRSGSGCAVRPRAIRRPSGRRPPPPLRPSRTRGGRPEAAATGALIKAARSNPTSANACRSSVVRYGPQSVGWVTVTAPGGVPSRSSARATTHRTAVAKRCSGRILSSPTAMGVSSPIRRINPRSTRSGQSIPCRSAAPPTSAWPSLVTKITDGREFPSSPKTRGSGLSGPPSTTRTIAAAVRLVPISMPRT